MWVKLLLWKVGNFHCDFYFEATLHHAKTCSHYNQPVTVWPALLVMSPLPFHSLCYVHTVSRGHEVVIWFQEAGSVPYMAVQCRGAAKLLFVETAVTLFRALCVDTCHSWTDHWASVQRITGIYLRSPGNVGQGEWGQRCGFFLWGLSNPEVFNSWPHLNLQKEI